MSTNLTSIDITTLKPSDLFWIVEEVNTTKTPRILKRDSEPVAMLMPVGAALKPKKHRAKTKLSVTTFYLSLLLILLASCYKVKKSLLH